MIAKVQEAAIITEVSMPAGRRVAPPFPTAARVAEAPAAAAAAAAFHPFL